MFEKQLGRVVEDYNTHCFECPIGYDSNNSSICKTTLFYFFKFSDAIIEFNYLHVTCTCNTSCFINITRYGMCSATLCGTCFSNFNIIKSY